MTNLHKRRKVIKDALLDVDDIRSEISATPKPTPSSVAVDQKSEASHHTHLSRQSKPASVHRQHSPLANVPLKSKRDSIASHTLRHDKVPTSASLQERRSPALSHISHHSHIHHHHVTLPQQQQRPATPSLSHNSQQQRQGSAMGSRHGSIPPFILPEQSSSQQQSPLNNVSLRRDRSLFDRNREGNSSALFLNDKQSADLSKVIYEAFNTTIHQIEEEDNTAMRDEAYKRVVANAKRKAMNVLKQLQVPPKMEDTVFDINLHKEKADGLRNQLKFEVDEYVELQLALAITEHKHENDKRKLQEIHDKLNEEQANFKADHDKLEARHPLMNAPPPNNDYAFNLLKYPASSFNLKRDT
ncbi:hypothetical protein K492DRAFT_207770 [Lichtheimia hyalospora FSU 10163]|nr:hypothetical protein K492DRAFT_207770 [Lichtheimia hyalospora FSU 10163]